MPYQPNLNFKLSDGRDLSSLGWITKEYLMTVYPQIAGQLITPELWTWGGNNNGQVGNNGDPFTDVVIPVTTFAGGANWKQVACGSFHTAAIKTDGTLWTWGTNLDGQLGDNTTISELTPVTTFSGGTNWKQVAGGTSHTAAIKTDGTLWTWGRNNNGQLGDNTTISELTPITTFAGGTDWKQVAGGTSHTAAIKTDGTLWTWGANNTGQLGDNTTTQRNTPVTTFSGGTNWKQVTCGDAHTAAVKTDGTLWDWGSNGYGQLGDNTTTQRNTPVTTFSGGTNWKQVSCGTNFTAAIKTDGTLWAWGRNNNGQLGDNTTTQRNTPVTTFSGGTNWKQVSSGNIHMAAIKTDGSLWTWGSNFFGVLGINSYSPGGRRTPVTTFAGGTNWKQVTCGSRHTAAIKTSDDLQVI
jgi:alpha-tubulin suppressor-like RCC1 family protein